MSGNARIRLVTIAGLLALLALLALLPATALAGKPVVFRDEWEGAPEFFADCAAAGYGDYMIVGESSGRIVVKEWYDADGNIERAQVFLYINNTIINTGTGQTWRDIGRHTDFFWEFTEFDPTMQKRAGVTYIIHDPDGGIILHDTGTITFNFATGEFEHVGGPHDVGEIGSEVEFLEVFCTTFA
jgi:hypothetical protein